MAKKKTTDKKIVVFAYTDIEGSTRISVKLKDKYNDLLSKHNQIIRSEIKKLRGREISNSGDNFFVIFQSVRDALQFAVNVQKALAVETWPGNNAVRVRIGLHMADAFKDGDYTNEDVTCCYRICDAGHGSQILLSHHIALWSEGEKPKGTELIDKGFYGLKGFHEPMRIYQLFIPGFGEKFQSPRSATAVPILGILPFKDLSVEKNNEDLCEGVAEDLIIRLGKIPELRVIARSSSFALKESSSETAADMLKATVILEGSIVKDKDRIKISVLLFEVVSGLNLWSEQFDGKISELFSFQDDISLKIAQIMQVGDGMRKLRGIHAIHSQDTEAYEYYLRGRRYFYQFSESAIRFAIRMYKKAIESDPKYALAYSGLAECYWYLYMYSKTDKRNLIQADQSSRIGIRLDPSLAEAWSSRGVVLSLKKKYEDAKNAFEKAMQLDPMLFEAPYQYARMSFVQGALEKATNLYEIASDLRPDDYQAPLLSAQSYEVMGMEEEAHKHRKKGIAIAEENLRLNPNDTRALSLAANGLVAIGDQEKAMDLLERALLLEPDDPMLLYNAGCIYAMCDMEDDAMNCLEKSAKTGLTQKEWYEHDDNLDSIREKQRFKDILGSMK